MKKSEKRDTMVKKTVRAGDICVLVVFEVVEAGFQAFGVIVVCLCALESLRFGWWYVS